MALYNVDFEPMGRRGKCQADHSLLDCARQLGVGLASICGGQGTCYSCKVQILSGTVSELTAIEQEVLSTQELEAGYRLACRAYPASDLKLYVPLESLTAPQRLQVEMLEVAVSAEPPVRSYQLKLSPPSPSDLRADAERLLESLEHYHGVRCQSIDIDVLRDLSAKLRAWDWAACAMVRGNEVVSLGSRLGRQLGLAVDLGTTKIAAYLVDIESGRTLTAQGVMNPQVGYGEDVITRIARTRGAPSEAIRLQELAVGALTRLASDLCAGVGAAPEDIVEAVVVGNTAMHHLLLRLPVEQLALSPYVPAVRDALDIKARDVGLRIAPGAYVHFLPNIAGFVGSDHVAMLLSTGVWRSDGVVLALDIGTNTEVALVSDGGVTSVSCASGPAFEGAHIKYGMRAASGAIERLRLVDERVEYQTIDGAQPVGICGSGILDALAQLYVAGVLSPDGRMGLDHPRAHVRDGEREFDLVSQEERDGKPPITITQQDVRELQLAKSAISTGIRVLLDAVNKSEQDIEQVIIAGAFGSYIDIASAVTVGMLPDLPVNRFHQVGNAAGMGAKLALISLSKRAEAQDIARGVRYIELGTAPRFEETFVKAINLRQAELD